MGKGDIKSRKGKISNGSYGNKRKRADNAVKFSLAGKPAAKKAEEKK
jgi:ribosomal small subunit protein bTHX